MSPKFSFPPKRHDEPPRPFSQVLRELAALDGDSVSVRTVQKAMADRSFAALIMFFAIINMMPLPLGSSLVLGVPILLLALQMARGLPSPWLPGFIRRRSISTETFKGIERKLTPWVEWFEKFIKPRRWPFDREIGEKILGVLIAFLAVLLIIPIPFGNWPPAFAIFILAIALSERDGYMLALGVAVSIASILVFAGSSAVIWFAVDGAINHLHKP